jgi:hypothetical protein
MLSDRADAKFRVERTKLRAFSAAARAHSINELRQAYPLVGKPDVVRIDSSQPSNPIALDDVHRSIDELPLMVRSLAEDQDIMSPKCSYVIGPIQSYVRRTLLVSQSSESVE